MDFYQREYVWGEKQILDLLMDLSTEFLRNWTPGDKGTKVAQYNPYFMGEVVLSARMTGKSAVIDGQQRITTLTLLLMYMVRKFGDFPGFPQDVRPLIYSDYYGEKLFNLDVEERNACMSALYRDGAYTLREDDSESVVNLVNRYSDIEEFWPDTINEENVVNFAYWLMNRVMFSKVWTNSDEFSYVIFETMNDRGLSLTQVEMLRSYLLANIDSTYRNSCMKDFDDVIRKLSAVKGPANSKTEYDFFKVFMRSKLARDFSQNQSAPSDFARIGKEFHRWLRDNEQILGLKSSKDFGCFIDKIKYFAKIYERVYSLIESRNTKDYLYLIVNNDYGFTMQCALIMAAVKYGDTDVIVDKKILIISKYITKMLTWRVWSHYLITQSALESVTYSLCKDTRDMTVDELDAFFGSDPIELPRMTGVPVLNQQNKRRMRVLLALLTEIVSRESGFPNYILNNREIEIEHIWADHYELHTDEFHEEAEFAAVRNSIGDLLVLPKSFNASYSDDPYETKVEHYYSQNVLAQSLNRLKYKNNPGFADFMARSGIRFKAYDHFTHDAINERSELYKAILFWNWGMQMEERKDANDRRAPFAFSMCNILPGEEIVYVNNPTVRPIVKDNKRVLYNGEEYFLSNLAQKLMGCAHPVQGPLFFTYHGEILVDLRKRFEDKDSESRNEKVTEVTENQTELRRLKYWEGFVKYLAEDESVQNQFSLSQPSKNSWYNLYIGIRGICISISQAQKNRQLTVELYIQNDKNAFRKLFQNREIIEHKLGFAMDWRELPEKKASRIIVAKTADFNHMENWEDYYAWSIDKAVRIRDVFGEYLRKK